MSREEEIAQAKKELEVLKAMPETLHPLMDGAFRSLQAIIDGQLPKALDWHKVCRLIIERRPRLVIVGMKHDKHVTRIIYENGELTDPVVAASSWDEPIISLDYATAEPCWVEVENLDAPAYCPTWPLIIKTRLKSAGIKITQSK